MALNVQLIISIAG